MSSNWKRALIIGASSGMGEELTKQLALSGCSVALVARRKEELERVAAAATAANSSITALIFPQDVREYECVPALFQKIAHDLGGLDLVIYTAGVMPRITDDEYSFEKDRLTIDVNVTGAVAWLNEAAVRFGRAKAGTIIGISSVAGDRGRKGNPVYCASKAALNTYLEALRNRVGRAGVQVLTVKPGPVDTPMTKGLDKLPMLVSVEQAATAILSAARAGKSQVYLPGKWRLIMFIVRHIPSFIFKKMNF